MRAFVTGGTGFIGANLVDGLSTRGLSSRVLLRENSPRAALEGLEYETAVADILDPPELLAGMMADCEWVFHVAAVSDYWRSGTERLYEINVQGTKNVLDAAKIAGVKRFVFTSSLAALGIPEDGHFLNEESVFNIEPKKMPYGHSKHLAEIEVQKAVSDGLHAVIVNPAVVLGARDINLISGSIIVEASRGLARFYPPGGVNYIAVEDVVAGHIAAAERGRVGERYILAHENMTHQEALNIICDLVGRPRPRLGIPRWSLPAISTVVSGARLLLGARVPMDANQVNLSGAMIFADGRKAIQEFALPQTPIALAVQNTYEWYNNNGYL